MHKYPILSGISGLARVVGWIILIIASVMFIVGLIQTLGAVGSAAQNPYRTNPLDLYQGIILLAGGASLLIVSLILILVSEVIKVFTDIEGNTARTAKALRILIGQEEATTPPPTPTIHVAAHGPVEGVRGIQKDLSKANTWKLNKGEPVNEASFAIIRRLGELGYQVEYYLNSDVVFSMSGKQTKCTSNREIQRFADRIRLQNA